MLTLRTKHSTIKFLNEMLQLFDIIFTDLYSKIFRKKRDN
jgi:hypothetical protein